MSERADEAVRWLKEVQFVEVDEGSGPYLLFRPGTGNPHDGSSVSVDLAAPGVLDTLGRFLAIVDGGSEPEFVTANDVERLVTWLDMWYASDDMAELGWVDAIDIRDLDAKKPVVYDPRATPSPELTRARQGALAMRPPSGWTWGGTRRCRGAGACVLRLGGRFHCARPSGSIGDG